MGGKFLEFYITKVKLKENIKLNRNFDIRNIIPYWK